MIKPSTLKTSSHGYIMIFPTFLFLGTLDRHIGIALGLISKNDLSPDRSNLDGFSEDLISIAYIFLLGVSIIRSTSAPADVL